MGSGYSYPQCVLESDCTSFEVSPTGATAQWGDSLEASMGYWKENNDHTQVWGVDYKASLNYHKLSCGFQLKAISGGGYDDNGVESVYFGFGSYETEFALKITRVAYGDGLSGGILGIDSSSGATPVSYARAEETCSIETTIVSHGCLKKDGLLVLEMKKKAKSKYAYAATLTHCYVIKDVGLSVAAKITRNTVGNGFGVDVEGPFKHAGDDLRKVIVKTCTTGVWSPATCPHYNGATAPTGIKIKGCYTSMKLKALSDHQLEDHAVPQLMNNGFSIIDKFYGNAGVSNIRYDWIRNRYGGREVNHVHWNNYVRKQFNEGFINSSGYTTGRYNNSIIVKKQTHTTFVFVNYNTWSKPPSFSMTPTNFLPKARSAKLEEALLIHFPFKTLLQQPKNCDGPAKSPSYDRKRYYDIKSILK